MPAGAHRLAVTLLFAGLAIAWVFVSPRPGWQPEWDGALYRLTAQSMQAGDGYAYLDQPFVLRPPGLSWLITQLGADDPDAVLTLHRLLGAFAVLAAIGLYAVLRRPAGALPALAAALLFGSSPLLALHANWVLAEFPALAFLLLGIAALESSGRRQDRWWPHAIAGALCLAASFWFRTVAILVVPGLLLLARPTAPGGRWRPMRALLPLLVFALAAAPWWLHARANTPAPRYDQLLVHDYGTAALHEDPGDPDSPLIGWSELSARMALNVERVGGDLAEAALHVSGLTGQLALGLLLIAGVILAARRGAPLLAWWGLGYGLLALSYFSPARRLALPLVPLACAALALLGAAWAARRTGRASRLLPLAVLAALVIGNAMKWPDALAPRGGLESPAGAALRVRDPAAVADWIRANVPEGATVLCDEAPVLSLLTARRMLTHRFRERSPDLIATYGADWVVFDLPAARAFEEEIAQRSMASWTVGAARVYRLGP